MRRSFIVLGVILLLQLLVASGLAQPDKLAGRWEGNVQAPQGERPAVVVFKKEGDTYTGTISGMRGDAELSLKEVKVDGDKVTAQSQIEIPQGSLTIKYNFVLQGETLKGKGEVDFGGQTRSFDFDLKRVGEKAAPGTAPSSQAQPSTPPQTQPQMRSQVPQPQQKQSPDYFAGQWTFKWLGRESPLGPGGSREGVTTFTKTADGKGLESRTEGKSEEGAYQESAVIGFDEQAKSLTFSEQRGKGVKIQSKGDWSSPISIRFTVEPFKVQGKTYQLRRTISIVAAHSFTVTEELSEDGGLFVRLGHAIFTKVTPSPARN